MKLNIKILQENEDICPPSSSHVLTRTESLILIAIIAVQLFAMVFIGCKKQGYSIDEIYSYILSNSYDSDRISTDASV